MKQEFYSEHGIRAQIKAGGADDWQIQIGDYIVSLRYTESPERNFRSQLAAPFRHSEQLSAIIYRRQSDGKKEAIRQISVPAKNANLWTDHRTELRVVAQHGRMCIFAVTASEGPKFLGGKWGRISSDVPIGTEEQQHGVTAAAERWASLKND